MATPTMPAGSTTTPKKRTFSTMAGETSPGLKLRISTVEDELDKESPYRRIKSMFRMPEKSES